MNLKDKVYLIGPFIGELSWEFFYFAPYIIYLKKKNPINKFIVFTRPERFDLYGKYADILVPLKMTNNDVKNQSNFYIRNFDIRKYNILVNSFKDQYKKRFKIIDHIYPDISSFYYKVKWQHSRVLMDYDFKPREYNKKIIHKFLNNNDILINIENMKNINENMKNINELVVQFNECINDKCSILGCVIESIKISKCVIGNLNSTVSRLSLLLQKPLITINDQCTNDDINLFNPLKTPIIRSSSIEEGIDIYENNF